MVKQVNWLGDVVIGLPALRAIRGAFPAAHLSLVVKRELAGFFDGCSWIDEVIPYRLRAGAAGLVDRGRLVAGLRARDFDLAILLPNSFDAAFWAWLAAVPERVGFATDARGWMLTRRAAPGPQATEGHQVHYLLEMLHQTLGIEGSPGDFAIEPAERNRERMRAWLAERRPTNGRLIALAPAAAFGPAKEWPAANYAELINLMAERFGADCVLVGAPNERAKCESIAATSKRGALVAAGETGVGELVALMSLCDAFAGNDSGSMHVAGALGIPTVGIYGSTRPWRTGPLGPRAATLYHQIECSPCLQRTCRFGHYDCLRGITPGEVVEALAKLGVFS